MSNSYLVSKYVGNVLRALGTHNIKGTKNCPLEKKVNFMAKKLLVTVAQ